MGLFSRKKQEPFPWKALSAIEQINEIKKDSQDTPIVIFKHSTRCSISSSALSRIERAVDDHNDNVVYYYLDLLNHRDISNELENEFNIMHQSPQALVIKDGVCVYHASHMQISLADLEASAV